MIRLVSLICKRGVCYCGIAAFLSFVVSLAIADEPRVGTLPTGSIVVEAESMALAGESDGWKVRDHERGAWYTGRPSGNQFLGGQSKSRANAQKTVEIQKPGRYALWVRYTDMTNYRTNNGFRIQGVQNAQIVLDQPFDEGDDASVRTTPEGLKKWGGGFARWVWAKAEFNAQAGPLDIQLSKIRPAGAHGCGRNVDVLILTDDLEYEPEIMDLYPFFVRIRVLKDQPYPVGIHFFGKRPFEPWYTPHANITQTGANQGVFAGLNKPDEFLAAGQTSPWVNLSPLMGYGGKNQINLYAIRRYGEIEPESFFAVDFSRAPSESGLIRSIERTGTGDGLFFSIDLTDYTLITELDGSADNLARAKAAPNCPGRAPERFPFFTGLNMSKERSTAQAVDNETQALATIGIVRNRLWPASHYFHLTDQPGCLSQPNRKRIEENMAESAARFSKTYNGLERAVALNAMDEPGFDFAHIESCDVCKAGFNDYLKTLGIDNSNGKLVLNNNPAESSLDQKRSYYYTRRYLDSIMTGMLRAGTEAAGKSWGKTPVTVNFATETLSGNMAQRGLDWYEIFNTGALTFGWTEDWGGWSRTYQSNGYLVDALKSACRQKNVPYGIYDVLCGATAWEIQAKGYMEIGHGCRAISFFNYGPEYAITSDVNSQRPEIYEGVKRLTFAVGAVEDAILAGRPAKGDAASLHSITCDLWHATGENPFGRERVALNLLLRHCGIAVDVLGEDELKPELGKYKVLFVTESHIRRELVSTIVDWTRAGGVLYLSAGALERDEFDQPLGLLEQLGVNRPEFKLEQQPGRPEYEMRSLKELDRVETETGSGVKIVCTKQGEPIQTREAGRGKVVLVGFFPGVSYFNEANKVENDEIYSVLDFPKPVRDFMGKILAGAAVESRLSTDNYRIEANLLESPEADLIVLSNWTGRPQTVTVCLKAPAKTGSIRSITGDLIKGEVVKSGAVVPDSLLITVRIGAGDIIELK